MRVPLLVVSVLLTSGCGTRHRPLPDQVVRESDRSGGTAVVLGDADRVEGTRFITLPIVPKSNNDNPYASFGSGAGLQRERNRLIVDTVSGVSRKVLPDERFEIEKWQVLGGQPSSDGDLDQSAIRKPVRSLPSDIYAAVVRRPARDQNVRPTYDVLLGHFSTGLQQWKVTTQSDVQSLWLTEQGIVAIIAAQNGAVIFRTFDSRDFHLLLESKLAF